MHPMETSSVRDQLLQHARSLLMARGYHGFSYHDLARLVGVKTSSIHYYFPKKEDLVLEAGPATRPHPMTAIQRTASVTSPPRMSMLPPS
jgi:TetR/AcrR family transcriptional regulator, transcriptional repressor for nem operon